MAKALVIGSIALDSVETPAGKRNPSLGGSASFGSVAASYFSDVSLVGVVGDDFGEEHLQKFRSRGIDISGIQRIAGGRTFHWSGYYKREMNQAFTNTTELNVFADFKPVLTAEQRRAQYVFLANIHPQLQLDVLDQIDDPKLIAVDTMNFWIEGEKQRLTEVIKRCDILLINEEEARQYCEKVNLIECGRELAMLGPRTVALKKGEHGALLFQKDRIVFFPAFPLQNIKDPTGAGDTFAGAMVGYLARLDSTSPDDIVRSVHIGTCMASFVVEEFSMDRTLNLKPGELAARAELVHQMVSLPALDHLTLEDIRK